jgi:hypothetical protein
MAPLLQLLSWEVFMSLTARHPVTNLYSVEVSGWDASESFFVERSELEWEEDAGKQVILHRMLREGAHIFVRLLQSFSSERSHPVPYEAHYSGSTPDGRWRFRLLPLRPREGRLRTL